MNFHEIIGKGVDEIDMTVTDETTYLDVFNTINQICFINYRIEAPSSGNKENIVRCLWVDLILKRIQNIVLTLMAIPKVYVRNIMSDSS